MVFELNLTNRRKGWSKRNKVTSVMWKNWQGINHYVDVIMTTMASQITSLMVVYSAVYSDTGQRKHKSSASLAFVWGIHRDRWIPRTKGQLRGKCFHLMTSSWLTSQYVGLSDLHSSCTLTHLIKERYCGYLLSNISRIMKCIHIMYFNYRNDRLRLDCRYINLH